ncbi:hypothetical protein ACFLUO_09130 [Chloroflexota bacterium]
MITTSMVVSNLIDLKHEIKDKKVIRKLVLYAVAASEIALIAQLAGARLPLSLFLSLVIPSLLGLIIKVTTR